MGEKGSMSLYLCCCSYPDHPFLLRHLRHLVLPSSSTTDRAVDESANHVSLESISTCTAISRPTSTSECRCW